MSNPKNPFEVTSAFMETTPFNYAGEGSDTLRLKNQYFDGVLFIHQNETCPGAPAPTAPRTRGGINIWDISDPEHPELLVKHAGDLDGGFDGQPNQTHSVFAWTSPFDGRTYAVLVDDEEFTDLDILDITDPRNPLHGERHARPGRAVRGRSGVAAESDVDLLARHVREARRPASRS